jgi:hypothetical protein
MNRLLALALSLAALGLLGCGPVVMIPGGALSGPVREPPASWAFTDEVETVQLETRPDAPYSVNIWCVRVGDALFVGGARESTWTRNAAADPEVRLRVDGDVYELRAIEATSDEEAEGFLAAVASKYDRELDPELRAEAILFRLTPRS